MASKADAEPQTFLYQMVSTMKDFGLSPKSWAALSRIDKKILYYYRLMDNYYTVLSNEKQLSDLKTKQTNSSFMSKRPRQNIMRGR